MRPPIKRICLVIVVLYAAASAFALLLIPLNAAGAFGMEPDPLSGIFAYLLAAPWSILLADLAGESYALNLSLVALGMLVNGAILLFLFRRVSA
ncbi:hypothetical protein [Mesorhizobium marinum]|uniref:hypothetical protein n=1 Tax=Mesorhizobium marinum TaxID=3228790 RepID=UPI0034670962